MVLASRKDGRMHDVTVFILDGYGRVAVIRKPFFVPGAWRVPSGGIHRGEDVEQGIKREMREETGLDIALRRYLLRIAVRFVSEWCSDGCCPEGQGQPSRVQPWVSHVFAATLPVPAPDAALQPEDHQEIAAARWATLDELQGPIRQALLGTGRGLFCYRVRLTDLAVEMLAKLGAELGDPPSRHYCDPSARDSSAP